MPQIMPNPAQDRSVFGDADIVTRQKSGTVSAHTANGLISSPKTQ